MRRIPPWLLSLVFLFAAPLLAAERPALSVQSDGQSIAIKPATTLPYTWVCIDKGGGKYAGVLAMVADGKPLTWIYQLAIDAPGPDPKPDPPKPDPPKPDPPTPNPDQIACVFLIHESKDATPAFNAILGDKAWKDALTANSIAWTTVDPSQDAKFATAYPEVLRLSKAAGWPALVWVGKNKIGKAEKCPPTPAELLAKFKQIGAIK
jgi:hypothetical protein